MSWTESEIEAVEQAARPPGNHAKMRPLPESPHGVLPDGKQDYRKYPLACLDGVEMSDVDFSRARSRKNEYGVDTMIQLTWVDCARVTFDGAGRFHRLNGTFRACSFRKIKTSGAALNGTFEQCDFTGANLRGAFLGANFHDCRFDEANLRVASWGASFSNCTFAGAQIHDLFADIRELVQGGEPVTFSCLNGTIVVGKAVHR